MLNNLEEAGERINLLVRETFENGKLQNFLDTLAKMPNISYGNCLLLKNQLEDVSKVLPKEVWEKYGKQINELAELLTLLFHKSKVPPPFCLRAPSITMAFPERIFNVQPFLTLK